MKGVSTLQVIPDPPIPIAQSSPNFSSSSAIDLDQPLICKLGQRCFDIFSVYALLKPDFHDCASVAMEFDADEEFRRAEAEFHAFVRQHIICFLVFIALYLTSYAFIRYWKTRSDNDELYSGDEDYFVYRISLWMCTFALAVAIGAVTLLPFSILGSEVLQAYPTNWYLQWLNWSLIHSMWNYVFVLSNLALFVFLPFSYFFIESQGLSWFSSDSTNARRIPMKGVMSRVYETAIVCILLAVLLIFFVDIIYSLLMPTAADYSPLSLFSNITTVNIPLIYSCLSLFGTIGLLITAPVGFARIFSVVSENVVRPPPASNPPDEGVLLAAKLEKMSAAYRQLGVAEGMRAMRSPAPAPRGGFYKTTTMFFPENALRGYQRVLESIKYPVIMLVLLVLTGLSVLMVGINTLKLVFGYRALPAYVEQMEVHSRHTFGIFGAVIEVIIILHRSTSCPLH
uniref:LMBR1-like membrane protein n=1 Tax=Steinernema glaseri TaxID=37863 RepID=A0A1I7YL72_9BILA